MTKCFSCQGEGKGTWCQYCLTSEVDAFGLHYAEGKEGTWIQTWSGNKLWPLSPTEDAIELMDLAVGMARENRYGKQTIHPYKVAEHCLIVSNLAERFARSQGASEDDVRMLALEGHLHDADEGILPDMPRPLKHEPTMQMGQFREAGKRILACVYKKFGVVSTPESHAIIDAIDKRLVLDEVSQVMRTPALYLERNAHLKPCGVELMCYGEDEALAAWLDRFAQLSEIDIGAATFLP